MTEIPTKFIVDNERIMDNIAFILNSNKKDPSSEIKFYETQVVTEEVIITNGEIATVTNFFQEKLREAFQPPDLHLPSGAIVRNPILDNIWSYLGADYPKFLSSGIDKYGYCVYGEITSYVKWKKSPVRPGNLTSYLKKQITSMDVSFSSFKAARDTDIKIYTADINLAYLNNFFILMAKNEDHLMFLKLLANDVKLFTVHTVDDDVKNGLAKLEKLGSKM